MSISSLPNVALNMSKDRADTSPLDDDWEEPTLITYVPQKDWSLHAETQKQFYDNLQGAIQEQNQLLASHHTLQLQRLTIIAIIQLASLAISGYTLLQILRALP